MNRVDRLVAIVLLLQSRRIIRAKDIADHFTISIRTVYRDVKALCEAGVPVAAEAGEGYSLVEGYHLPPVMFTTDEASALFLGGKFVEKLTDVSMIKNAQSALLKIQAVLPDETQSHLERLQETTQIYLRGPEIQEGFRDDTLAMLQEAIVRQKVISMEYYSHHRDSFSRREVEPLGLLYYSRHWHLISYCLWRENFRDFRTDRIRKITLTDDLFRPRAGYSLKNFLENFDELQDPVQVKVKYHKSIAASVREQFYFGLIEEKQLKDSVIMTFVVPRLEMIVPSLLANGTSAQVISPKELQIKLYEIAAKIAKTYQGTSV